MARVLVYIAEFGSYRRRSKSGRIGMVNRRDGKKSPFTPLGKYKRWRRNSEAFSRSAVAIGEKNARIAGVKGDNLVSRLLNRITDPRERAKQDRSTAKTLRDLQM